MPGVLHGAQHQRLGRLPQRLGSLSGAILDHHAKAAGGADAEHRRRQHRDDEGVLDDRQPAVQLGLDRRRRLARIVAALGVIVEHQKQRAGIGRIGEGRAGEADDVHGMRHAGHAHRDVERALLHLVGAGERGARRQLHDDDDIAAVDLRDEADRRRAERVQAERDDDEIDRDHHDRAPHGAAWQARKCRSRPCRSRD